MNTPSEASLVLRVLRSCMICNYFICPQKGLSGKVVIPEVEIKVNYHTNAFQHMIQVVNTSCEYQYC